MPVIRDDQQGKKAGAAPTYAPPTKPVRAPAAVTPTPVKRTPGEIKTSIEPTPAVPKLERPVPVLQQHGAQYGIDTFNHRVQTVHDTYTKTYGVPPSPGLVFDLAKSPVDTAQFSKMFEVPRTQFGARARGAINAQGGPAPAPVYTAKDVAEQAMKAAQTGNYHQFVVDNADAIHGLSKGDSKDAAVIAGGLMRARRLETYRDLEQQVAAGTLSPAGMHQQLQAAGFVPGGSAFKAAKGVGGFIATAIGQVTDSLIHAPGGVVVLGKAAGLDTRDMVLHPASNQHFSRTAPIAKAVATGVKEDVQHPLRNPGYLFLDILGVASVGASGVAKVGEAGRVLRAGEGLGKASKALVKKPPLRTVELNHGGFTEHMPLSQNPLVAEAQKFIIGRREAGAAKKLEGGDIPSGLKSVLLPGVAQEFLDTQFSYAKKLGREADARKRVDHVVQTTLSRELDHVAGRAVMQARMFSRVPSKLRGALTRGEQKAIQVQSWDDLNPLQAERDFHQRMIDLGVGDPKEHLRQLADLKLAERALKNPSTRFQKALDLTRQVVAEQQRIKIEDLGLLPETAEGRVAKAGAVLRDDGVVPREPVSDQSFYLPTQARGKGKRPPSDRPGYFPVKPGQFGVPLPRDMPELTHEFTGKAIMAGDFRIDSTSLATEAYGRTVRAATVKSEHNKLWKAASPTQRSRFDVPIRDSQAIPDKLREVVARLDEGDFTQAEADILPTDMRDLIEQLYPDPRKLTAEEIQGVRWVDSRLLGEGSSMPHVPGGAARVTQFVSAPLRFTTLYLRPAYILNKLGNHAMLLFDQGWVHPVNFVKAMTAETRYGEESARTIRNLVGAGRSESYVTSSSGKMSQSVAHFWNRVADRDERVTAFIYYMERKGYKSREDVNRLLNDHEARGDLVEITRRSNKSLVEFDNQLPIEKNYIRHLIFVYPWVSRSAVWSIRAVLEHPLKTDLLTQLGRQEYENDPIFKNAPAWFKRVGYVPIGFNHDGTPKVVNPTSVNTFSTIGDFISLGRAVTTGDKYSSAEDFLGPFPKFLIHAVTGRDDYGNKYPGSQWMAAAKDVLVGLPQVAAYERAGKAKTGAATLPNIADRSSLLADFNKNLKATVMSPGWLDGYGSLLAGGFSPRGLNTDALTARYWADQNPEVRHAHELDFLNRALNMQGEALQQKVPANVRAAVQDLSNLDFAYKKFLKETGRAPTDKERANFTISYLSKQGVLPASEAAKARAALKPLADPSDISRLKGQLLDKYANGKALRQWDTDVRAVASFTPDIVNQKAAELYKQGLVPQKRYPVDQSKLYDYGRKFVAFTHQVKAMKARGATDAELRAFQDKNDHPVDGLPSFVRMAWANQTPEDQQNSIDSAVTQNWGDLTAFDKALLGRPSDPKITAGWAKLKEIVADQKTGLRRQGRSFPAGYSRTLAQYVEKYYDAPGLVKDYDFSRKPTAERLKYLKPIQDSPHQDLWSQLLAAATGYRKYLTQKDGNGSHVYNSTQVRQSWADYVNSDAFQSAINSNPSFKTELQGYGKDFLPSLIG